MKNYKLAFLGFGNVGKALARLLLQKKEELANRYDLSFTVTGIATGSHGCAINHGGIDLDHALSVKDFSSLSDQMIGSDVVGFIQDCQADVLFENTPVNYKDGQPAAEHIRLALENGVHVITANKGPVVHQYRSLSSLAMKMDRKFYFESTVMDGAPIFGMFRSALPGAQLTSFRGILNSTTNMILTRMEDGESFDQAVAYCQEIGIAETDPSGDVDGWDAAIKCCVLSNVLMGASLKPTDVDRLGIRDITSQDILDAKKQGKRWKLICSARKENGSVLAKVAPELVSIDSPMFGVGGTSSIVQFETDVLGLLSIVEDDPGPHTTAYGLLADTINAVR